MDEGEVVAQNGRRAGWFIAGIVFAMIAFGGFSYFQSYFGDNEADVTADMPDGILLEKN